MADLLSISDHQQAAMNRYKEFLQAKESTGVACPHCPSVALEFRSKPVLADPPFRLAACPECGFSTHLVDF